jgi:aminoglycoside phosphotransferase (APT) family kinase protein
MVGMATVESELSDELRSWIESSVGGTIREVRRQARWRPTYFIDVDAPDHDTVVLKMARAPKHVIERSALLRTFNTNREALLLRVLGGSDVRVPPFVGFHEPTGSLLMDKLSGSAQVHVVDDPARMRAISEDFADELVKLHSIDLDGHEITNDLMIPRTADELALANFLAYSETDLDTVLGKRPHLADPLLTLARQWVHRRVPSFDRAPRMVQGDCGPDQFLFDADRVVAIIDWELAHIGDPMLDLGAMRLRECLYPAGMFPIVLERYRERLPVDEFAIQYYTVVTILFTLFGTIGGTVRLDPRNDEVIQQLWWQVSLRRVLCEAIAEAEGIVLAVPEPVEPVDDTDTRMQALLGDRLHHLAQRGEPFTSELRSTLALADAITNAQRQRSGRDASVRDVAALLGVTLTDAADASMQLDQRLRSEPMTDVEPFLQVLYNQARREQEAWLPLMRADRWTEDDGEMVEGLREQHEALGLTLLHREVASGDVLG